MICGRNTQESPAAVSPVMWIEKCSPTGGLFYCRGKKKDRGVWKRVGVVKHSHGNDLLDFYILKIVFFLSFFFKHTIDTASSLHINASRTVYLL